ncbi:MAG: hypothetical protein GY862_07020 [Gammaproteobacteria bacterium]|nr:hypothetical protein [Gammaproteobacteria bacterium]
MNSLSNPDSDAVIVDGDAVILMRALRNHSVLSHDGLKELVSRHLATDESFDPVLTHLKQQQWIQHSDDDIRLTEPGETWLDRHSGELAVEEESRNDGAAKKLTMSPS